MNRMRRPEMKSFSDLRIVKPEIIKLDNGIPVYIINLGDQQACRVDILVEGGKCDEPIPATCEMATALLREGTLAQNAAEIAEALDFYGSWLGCDATTHSTTLSLYAINRHFNKVLPIFADIAQQPSFPEQELCNLRNLVKTRLRNNQEKVSYLALLNFFSHYYGASHPLGNMPTEKTTDTILRDTVQSFHSQWYKPGNAAVILSGAVSNDQIKSLNTYFGNEWGKTGTLISNSDKPDGCFSPKTIFIDKPGAKQCAIRIGIPAILRTHKDYIPLRILTTAFGGYFGSRLMSNIREEKGYTYGISASLIGHRNNSYITVSCQCDNTYALSVLEEIRIEIRKLKQASMPVKELKRVRSSIFCDLAKTLDTPFSIADYYISMLSNHIPKTYFEDQIRILQTITPEALQEIAIKHLDENRMLTVLAGDKQQIGQPS